MLITLIAVASTFDSESAEALANLLGLYPFIWSTVIIIICAGAVSSESGVVADSILSKAVTRAQYLGAKYIARLLAVVGVFLAVTLAGAYLIGQNATTNTYEIDGMFFGMLAVAMMLAFLVDLTVSLSAILGRTLLALMGSWFFWYAAAAILALFELEFLSPANIVEDLPHVIAGDYDLGDQIAIIIGFGVANAALVMATFAYYARRDL